MYRTFESGGLDGSRFVAGRRNMLRLYGGWIAVSFLAIGQDAWFAFLKDTSFYWGESLLYKIYWLLFIPQTLLVADLANRWPIQSSFLNNGGKHLVASFLSSLAQVLVFSGLVAGLSRPLLGYAFRFEGVLRKALAEDFFTGILMYGLLLLVFYRFSGTNKGLEKGRADILPKTKASPEYLTALLVKDGAKTLRIQANSLDWIGSEDSYTVLHRAEGKWLYSESLTELEKRLNPEDFVRIHRSSIVNIQRVQKVTSRLTGDYDLQLLDGTMLRLSRHYVRKVKGRLL